MRHASLVVLALLAEGPRHGYDLEQVIRGRHIRLWAKIGTSTVYKTLQDLKADGCLVSEAGIPARGAGREVFSITPDGRAQLSELVAQGFRSQASLYSDRIVAMAFTHSVAREEAADELARARTGTGFALEELDRVRGTTDNAMAHVILDFHTDVMIAERKAMEATARALGLDLNEEEVGIDERARNRLKRARLTRDVFEIRGRKWLEGRTRGFGLIEENEALGVREGQRTDHHRVHYGEDRSIRAYSKRDRDQDRDGDQGRSPQAPQRESQVSQQVGVDGRQ